MYEPVNFNYLEHELNNKDVTESHRWNYLRHRSWMRKRKDSKES